MNSLCLSGDGLTASLFAAALHFGWTPADGIAREESWHVRDSGFEFFAERARRDGGWQHAWPARGREKKLILRREGLVADYVICGEMWCVPLEKLLPRSRAAVVEISPC